MLENISDAVVKIKIMLYTLKAQNILNEHLFSKGTLSICSLVFQQNSQNSTSDSRKVKSKHLSLSYFEIKKILYII